MRISTPLLITIAIGFPTFGQKPSPPVKENAGRAAYERERIANDISFEGDDDYLADIRESRATRPRKKSMTMVMFEKYQAVKIAAQEKSKAAWARLKAGPSNSWSCRCAANCNFTANSRCYEEFANPSSDVEFASPVKKIGSNNDVEFAIPVKKIGHGVQKEDVSASTNPFNNFYRPDYESLLTSAGNVSISKQRRRSRIIKTEPQRNTFKPSLSVVPEQSSEAGNLTSKSDVNDIDQSADYLNTEIRVPSVANPIGNVDFPDLLADTIPN